MIQVKEISGAATKAGVKDIQIEKDYVISWILYGIAEIPFLKENLIFKGGTVLKKAYFPAYRFSEELEFSIKGGFNPEDIKSVFSELIKIVFEKSGITLSLKGDTREDANYYNFGISYKGPLGGSASGKNIRVDIAKNELVYNPPVEKEIASTYSDLVNKKVYLLCYTLDEIVAEKMCSLMQRTSSRDIYDIWYLLEMDGHVIEDCIFTFQEKAKLKKLDPKDLKGIIEKNVQGFAKHWRDHLSHQMKKVPDYHDTWRSLEKYWRRYQRFIEAM